jgi:hypothetical protein
MSSSSLYGYTGNVTVSANNLTTLYNAQPGNVVVANVPDRNFTTLYTNQAEISPTKPYGNSNVEAFLNAGTDGSNVVQNINMSGTLTVGGLSYLGNVGNVHIDGGNSGFILATNGSGDLTWIDPTTTGSGTDYIHFDVTVNGNNQTFTNSNLSTYGSNVEMNVMKNGVNIEPEFYVKTASDTLQINIPLQAGDDIDVLASSGGGGTLPAGLTGEVQYNGGYGFAANSSFTFDEANSLLTVTNIDVTDVTVAGNTDLGAVGNVTITGGTNGYVLATDGSGSLSWVAQATGATVAGTNTQVQFNDSGSFGANSQFTYDTTTNLLTVGNISANGSQLSSITGANVTGTVANAAYALNAGNAQQANIANTSNVSYSVSGSNVVGQVANALIAGTVYTAAQPTITSLGNLTSLTSNGVVNFTNSSNVSLGAVGNLHISGGSANYYLKTDGAGNLSWDTVSTSGGTPGGLNTYVQFNDASTFGGVANFAFNKLTNTLSITNVSTSSITNILGAVERSVFTGPVSTSYTYDTSLSSVVLCTVDTSSNFTINFTNLSLNTNDVRSFAFINKNTSGNSFYCTGISIGGAAQTVNWSGGSAPISGNLYDIYNITVIKTSATPTYVVFAGVGGY